MTQQKKEEKENQEKQENRYQVVLRAVFYLSVPGAITSSSHEETLWKLKTENEGVVKWHNNKQTKLKETENKEFMTIVLPYECVNDWSKNLLKNGSRKVHISGEGVIDSAH